MAVGRPVELIEFRRAFVWLLCAVLVPSVALVAFGVVPEAAEALGLGPLLQRAAGLPAGGHAFATPRSGPEQGLFVAVRRMGAASAGAARIDLVRLASAVAKLPSARTPVGRANYRLGTL